MSAILRTFPMKSVPSAARSIVTVIVALATAHVAAQQSLFQSRTDTVSIYATVNDRSGRLAPSLTAADFRILDNGKPAEITVFSSEIQTITTTLMLDMSGSMVPRLLWTRDAAEHLIDELKGADRARIGTFGSEVAISPHLTADKLLLKRVLRDEIWPGGGTPLWVALDAAMASMKGEQGRRIVLVVTDGNDSTSRDIDRGDVRKRALREEFMIYAVAINGHELNSDLSDVATETGGGYVIVDDRDDLKKTLSDVVNDLRHQYLLGFSPSVLDGKTHKLKVEVTKPGLTARGPTAYLAAAK